MALKQACCAFKRRYNIAMTKRNILVAPMLSRKLLHNKKDKMFRYFCILVACTASCPGAIRPKVTAVMRVRLEGLIAVMEREGDQPK